MKLAIADPPYLGRAARWYGEGRGGGAGKGKPDYHPSAAEWDDPHRHEQLVRDLTTDYDGWAIAAAAQTLGSYLAVVPEDARVMVWHRENAAPSGSRVRNVWEPVIVKIPTARRGYTSGMGVHDVLRCGQGRGVRAGDRFTGAKPEEWTRWVLTVLGYDPSIDTVDDLFYGSGAVAQALTQGMIL